MRVKKSKIKQAQGVISRCSSRLAKSRSYAHSFYIDEEHFSIFIEEDLSPVTEGDYVRFDYEIRRLRSRYHAQYNAVIIDSLIIDVPKELGHRFGGQVYILSNPSMPGLLKVGFTAGTALKRASELSSVTGVPTEFKVEWILPVLGNPRAVERSVHAHLAEHRHGKEFFKVPVEVAKSACIQSFSKLYPEHALTMEEAFSTRAQAEINRRQELKNIKARSEKNRKEIEEKNDEEVRKARLTFIKRQENIWASEGKVRIVLMNYSTMPNHAKPTFLAKLFGVKFEDYLEIYISPSQHDDHLRWSVCVRGRKNWQVLCEQHTFENYKDCITTMSQIIERYGIPNCSSILEIPNILIENPPKVHAEYQKPYLVLSIDSLNDLVIRPV